MGINYQYILQIAADALSTKYPLSYGLLYWYGDDQTLENKASITITPQDQTTENSSYTISPSMVGAIKKTLVIARSRSDRPYSQIIIPLVIEGQKAGLLAFWGAPFEEAPTAEDRLLMNMVGTLSLRFLKGLCEGEIFQVDEQAGRFSGEPEKSNLDNDDFIEIEYDEEEENKVNTSKPEIEETGEVFDFESEKVEEGRIDEPLQFSDDDLQTDFSETNDEERDPKTRVGGFEDLNGTLNEKGLELFLENSGIGFVAFDKDCQIDPGFKLTKSEFFNTSLDEQTALELLFEWGDPVNEDSASFEKHPDYGMIKELMSTVFTRITDLDVLKELLPKEIGVCDRVFRMEFHYLKHTESASDDRILAVFRDVSEEKALHYQYNTEVERSNMIVKVALDIDGYYHYRAATEKALDMVSTELTKSADEVSFERVLHQFQDILGGAEIYEIHEITATIESIIATIEDLQFREQAATKSEITELKERVDLVRDVFETLQKQYLNNLVSDEKLLDNAVYRITSAKISRIGEELREKVLKEQAKNLEDVFEKNYRPFTRLKSLEEVTQKRLESIKGYLQSEIIDRGSKELEKVMADFRKQPIGLMLKRYAIIAVNLGERYKKRVEVEIKGAEIEVPFHTLEHLFTGLTFVIRNSVEHGLENMQERMDQDKSLEGNIKINASLDDNVLSIEISDDGRGIEVETVRRAAVNNAIISASEAETASDKEILALMFKKGFSTKKDARGSFGRGVGLNAVGTAVDELGGNVAIQTELKKGTTVSVSVLLPN